MKLPDAPWRRRPGLKPLLAALNAAGGATRFVGGCVRDTLIGVATSDIDLATRLEPEEVVRRLGKARIKAVPTGIAHGTITAVSAGLPVEVTTLRRDVSTDGRRATIAFTWDWREDAARRDFTINALSADPASGEIFDYFGGLDDLAARRVRFIGLPETRIAEDHLRILRFFRFHARFGSGEPDAEGLTACTARANDLMALSRERIADELLKLLVLPDPVTTVRIMLAHGIFSPIVPEIDAAGAARLERLCRREHEAGIAPAGLRRLTALLPREPRVAESVGGRLRLSKKAVARLAAASEAGHWEAPPAQLAYWIGSDSAIDRILLGDGDAAEARMLDDWRRPSFNLTGNDLMRSGVTPGVEVGRVLREIERRWVEEGFPGSARVGAIAKDVIDQALRSSQ